LKRCRKNRGEIAALIIEPLPGNIGTIPPKKGYLEKIREITQKEGIILIFDEVMSGFRVTFGGMVEMTGIKPDLATYGKIIGGGLPVGCYGGRRDLMEQVSPSGKIYQAGTLSGNPLAMSMGIAVLNRLKNNQQIYEELENKAKKLEEGFNANIEKTGTRAVVSRFKSMISLFFTDKDIKYYSDVMTSDTAMYAKYFQSMLQSEILLPPAQYEVMFMNTTLKDENLDYTIKANLKALMEINKTN